MSRWRGCQASLVKKNPLVRIQHAALALLVVVATRLLGKQQSQVRFLHLALMYDKKLGDFNRANRRREVLRRYKRMKGCTRCGYKASALALEFNHLDYTNKKRTVASLMYYSWSKIKDEIAKCEILCANCHQIETLSISSPTRQRQRS